MSKGIENVDIKISDHFTINKLLKFAILPMVGMVLGTIYSVIDAWFVARFINNTAFSAITLAMPFLLILPAVGFMIGGGGNALVSKVLGENDRDRANQIFSMLVEFSILAGVVMIFIGMILLDPFLKWQGVDGELLTGSKIYARIMIFSIVFASANYVFQLFLITVGQQKKALTITLIMGLTDIVFNSIFIIGLHLGLMGAAIASVITQMVGPLLAFIYFASGKNEILQFKKTKIEINVCLKACGNGISEMIENIAESVVGILFNWQLLKIAGEYGISAHGAVMYIWYIFILLIVGFNEATVPLIAYQFGAKNDIELKSLLKKCLIIVNVASILMFFIAEIGSKGLAELFIHDNEILLEMTIRGFKICGSALLFLGFNYFTISFFTALNNGLVSGILSILLILFFPIVLVLILPHFLGMDGIWLAQTITYILGFCCSISALLINRQKYDY